LRSTFEGESGGRDGRRGREVKGEGGGGGGGDRRREKEGGGGSCQVLNRQCIEWQGR